MLGFAMMLSSLVPSLNICKPFRSLLCANPILFSSTVSKIRIRRDPRIQEKIFSTFAATDSQSEKELKKKQESKRGEEEFEEKLKSRGDGGMGFNQRWKDLLAPDPDNIFALGLTGAVAWASLQVLWQIFFVSFAIFIAALKYSFVAALLIIILITLL